jgi:hypothetical protein
MSADFPTAPLSSPTIEALTRLEAAFAPALAEQHRIERIVAGLRAGESAVINGVECTAVSLAAAVLLDRYREASQRCRRLAAAPDTDFDAVLLAQDEMRACRCQLAAAGRLDLIGVAS